MKLDSDGMPIEDENDPLIGTDDDDDGDELLGLDFDEDGNFIESGIATVDNEDEEQSDEQQSDEDEQEEAEEIPQEENDDEEVSTTTKNKPTKADIKIINLKKANAELIRKQSELQKQLEEQTFNKQKESLVEKYMSDGYDEETAKDMASDKVKLTEIEKKLELFTFKEENEELFLKFPEAKANLSLIMNNSKLTGMTPEQICKGLYGTSVPLNEQRATQSAKGQSTRNVNPNTNVARVVTGTRTNESSSLSQSDLNYKRQLEITFNGGKQLSNEEFMSIKNKKR